MGVQDRNGRKTIAFRTCKGESYRETHGELGDGPYLKMEGKLYDDSGFLLGPNSPFKNIPF